MRIEEVRAAIARGRSLNAFISLTDEAGPGAVVAVKDLVDVAGTVTTGGTAPGLLNSAPAAADAPVVAKIRRRGGVVVGKTNLINVPAPAGEGLPVGIQVVGRREDEAGLIAVAAALEARWAAVNGEGERAPSMSSPG